MSPDSIFGRRLDEVAPEGALPLDEGEPVAAEPLAHDRGERLRFRLRRDVPRRADAAVSIGCALLCVAAGTAGVGWAAWRVFAKADVGLLVIVAAMVGFVFVSVGVPALIGGLRELLALRTPEAIVELSEAELRPGDRIFAVLIQAGPAKIETLSLSLTCERSVRSMSTVVEGDADYDPNDKRSYGSNEEDRPRRPVKVPTWSTLPYTVQTLISEENLVIEKDRPLVRRVEFTVPEDAEPSIARKNLKYAWHFAVDVQPRLWAPSSHRFPVIVRTRDSIG